MFPPHERWSELRRGRSERRCRARGEYLRASPARSSWVRAAGRWRLAPGDVVVFKGDQRHSYANPGARTAAGYSVVVLARVGY